MEWSNQKILTFLELLKTERPIWDPNDKHHKCKRKVDDAWRRISARLDNTPINELKTKKRSLMATFRPLLKKKIISVMSGAVSDEDVYQPIWFAYNILESFMGFIYDEWSIKMENGNEQNDETSDQDQDDTINDRNDDSPNDQEDEQTDDESRRETRKKTSSLKRYRDSIKTISNDPTNFEMDTAQKNINDSFRTLNKVLDSKKEEDDCDLYAKLLAKKLRKYPGNMRLKIMYSIDGIIIDNPYPAQQASSSSVASYSISSSSTHPLPADPLCIYQPESSDLKQNDNMNGPIMNLNMD